MNSAIAPGIVAMGPVGRLAADDAANETLETCYATIDFGHARGLGRDDSMPGTRKRPSGAVDTPRFATKGAEIRAPDRLVTHFGHIVEYYDL
jgi:hypothetical protein